MYGDALREFDEASRLDLTHTIGAVSRTLTAAIFERLAERGFGDVHQAHVAVFSALDPEGTRVSTLAARAGISRQAMSALVRTVAAAGYVTTESDPTDQRATIVRLDRRGAEFCRAAVVASAEANARIEQSLGPAETARLRDILLILGE
ncbi:MarR family winged helix-turn-helix transcriptional regulator [Agromyces sp. NPDC056965]|uniref:MarR family winged helix-turn-helix transcriptional regulator n=1 Tax=Agromyces sp. NPDC056965 TaxID=3345983 RepID=UPI00362B3BFF